MKVASKTIIPVGKIVRVFYDNFNEVEIVTVSANHVDQKVFGLIWQDCPTKETK